MKVEYKVRPITRYVVTRYEENERGAACDQRGIYENGELAYQVAYALCKAEHDASGLPIDSEAFQYPEIPADVSVATAPVW